MNKKLIIIGVLVIVIIAGVVFLYLQGSDKGKFFINSPVDSNKNIENQSYDQQPADLQSTQKRIPSSPQVKSYRIAITSSGFEPSQLIINKGDTVIWENQDVLSHQVASDPHRAHSNLPGLESPVLNKGQSYSFIF